MFFPNFQLDIELYPMELSVTSILSWSRKEKKFKQIHIDIKYDLGRFNIFDCLHIQSYKIRFLSRHAFLYLSFTCLFVLENDYGCLYDQFLWHLIFSYFLHFILSGFKIYQWLHLASFGDFADIIYRSNEVPHARLYLYTLSRVTALVERVHNINTLDFLIYFNASSNTHLIL